MERKLTVIFAADVVGFTRMMRNNEETTYATLKNYQDTIVTTISAHGGRVFGSAGDSIIAEFSSAVEAVISAVEIQTELKRKNRNLEDDHKLTFRIGINIGDVMSEDANLFGDGVNIASRLEGLSDPGGLCVSSNVYEQVRRKVPYIFEDMGPQYVKNIEETVEAYRLIQSNGESLQRADILSSKQATKRHNALILSIFSAIILLLVIGSGWYLIGNKPSETEGAVLDAAGLNIPSIAVLPFANVSADPKQEFFADGITEDLITDLSKVSGLFVIARTSVFSYKDVKVTVQEVAQNLGVRYILEGSVRREGNQVRINVQLNDAKTGLHLWAERYDGALTDIFALQDSVTAKIVENLRVELALKIKTPAFVVSAVQKLPNDSAIIEAKRAIDRDANNPDGYLGLAELLIFAGEPQMAIPIIEYAQLLDPLKPSRYSFALGLAQLGSGDTKMAVETLERGIEKDSQNIHLWFLLSAAYGLLENDNAAKDAVKGLVSLKKTLRIPESIFTIRHFKSWGFKRETDIDRIIQGLRFAGVSE